MPRYGVAEAKRSFFDLVRRAEAGEEVIITRRGKIMVTLTTRSVAAIADELPASIVAR